MKKESVRRARGHAQRTRGHAQASVQPINRSAWSSCNSSLGTPPLSHFTHHHHNTIIHHHHPLSIIECVSRLEIQD
ncbi:hypothetical protein HanRHA438_Chr07g0300161 [Helianthus annuus]|nr:hypothetical protein HanRHA438_Chr07g0300161 [Helianthus annuus]